MKARKILSLLLSLCLALSLFAGVPMTASADENAVWEDGKVINEDLTLDGSAYTAENPLTVEVRGTVTVNATIYFTGYVKLVGGEGARILRGPDTPAKSRTLWGNDDALQQVTLENLTVDGGGVKVSQQLMTFSKGNLTLRNVRVVNGYSTSFGTTLLQFSNKSGTCLVEGCTFENNTLGVNGASKSNIINISDSKATDMNVRISNTTFRNNGDSIQLNWTNCANVTLESGNVFECADATYAVNCTKMPTLPAGADDLTFHALFRFNKQVGYLLFDKASSSWQWYAEAPESSLLVTSKAVGVDTANTTANLGFPIHKAGDTVRFDVTPAQNSNKAYYVSKVTISPAAGGDETELTKDQDGYYSFTMPDYSVLVTLTTENKPLHTVTVIEPEHGSLSLKSPSNGQAYEGQLVMLNEAADDGYVLLSLTWQIAGSEPVPITGTAYVSGDPTPYWKFNMPAQDATVTAVYGKTPMTLSSEATGEGLTLSLTGERLPEAGAAGTLRVENGVLVLDASNAETSGTVLTAELNGNSLMSIADADEISAIKLLTPLGDLRLERARLEQLNRLRQSSLTLRLTRETETDASVLTGDKLSGTASAAYTLELLGADGKALLIGNLEADITLRNVPAPEAELWQAGSATVRRCETAAEGSSVSFTASVPAVYLFGTLTPAADMPPVSADGYYEISTAAQLAWAAQNAAGANLRLTADINVDEAEGWQPFAAFSGHFDGAGHTVSGAISAQKLGGLFITATNAVIENLTVEGTVTSTENSYGVGGIVGTFDGSTLTISDCYNTGKIDGLRGAGGATGYGSGILARILSKGKVSISNCYTTGAISCHRLGESGDFSSDIEKYNLGQIVDDVLDGAVVTVTNCYYQEITPVPADGSVAYGESKTADELKSEAMLTALGSAFRADSSEPINGGYPILAWQAGTTTYAVTTTLTAPEEANAVLTINGQTAVSGETLMIAENADVSWELVIAKEYEISGWTVNGQAVQYSTSATATTATYSFSTTVTEELTAAITVRKKNVDIPDKGDVNAPVWDGRSIDVSWYDPDATEYYISTPAQLAGLAAIVNGIYNKEIDTFKGNTSYIVDNTGESEDDGPNGNNKATSSYHYGSDNFNGKTVYLTADIDMGEGNNYMPIGGQYLMTPFDSTTRIDASFCGVFDGQGHSVTIYCDRYAGAQYGDGQSVGFIGRLGVHDNERNTIPNTGATVRDVAVYGSVYANRSVGGVVGKTGQGEDKLIERCANFATVTGTDAKGTGGICGAAWNGVTIRDCYNAGAVTNTGKPAVGGIAGSNEATIINCYNVGTITGPMGNTTAAIATANGGDTYENCYWLSGSADVGVYNKTLDSVVEKSSAELKSAEMLTLLGSAFAADTAKINNGYPVLYWQSTGSSDPDPTPVTPGKTETGLPFTDVDGHWAIDAIRYAYENKLFNGVSDTEFAPNTAMTRGMLVTVLYRLEGEPTVTANAKFSDVAEDQWYAKAVAWAAENEIVKGYGSTFGPNDLVTREQMATILLRYAVWKQYDTTAGGMALLEYADYAEISGWATAALEWANAEGLILGRTETTIVPQGDATRAEVATILMRFIEKFVK